MRVPTQTTRPRAARATVVAGLLAGALVAMAGPLAGRLAGEEWPGWRGPRQDGVSTETGLVDGWSPAGENLLWKAELIGRSTPVVFDGRVCANGRVGSGVTRQETAACFDAGSGRKLWQVNLDVYHTTVPFNRVGWSNLAADAETGNLYAHGVGGLLVALDRDGKTVWWHNLFEEYGFYSGFGGRTHTPVVDEDRLVLSFISSSWGDGLPPRQRTYAFDKRTGAVLWVATPGGNPYERNTSTTPVAAVVGGRRLLVEANADGWIYALAARTGEKVWGFRLSKNMLNTTVAVGGTIVYAAHSEENVDSLTMGRVVAIDATGGGDVTKTHEVWRADELGVGFSSPLLHQGLLYVVDNSGTLFCLDAADGKVRWKHKLGTVGKASPVWADGKLYVPELNGRFHILAPGPDGVRALDEEVIKLVDATSGPEGRYAELYGSAAVAYGRVYLSTEAGLFAIGDRAKPFRPTPGPPAAPAEPPASAGAVPASLLVSPTEVLIEPGAPLQLTARAFDAQGKPLGEVQVEWALQGLIGTIEGGRFTPAPGRSQAGKVTARLAAPGGGALEAAARVRVVAPLPWSEDFEGIEPGKNPPWWLRAGEQFTVREVEGGKALVKPPVERGLDRADVVLGPSTLADYTVEADLRGGLRGRRRPDMGLNNSGYTLDLMGNHQKLQVRAWTSELRFEKSVPFAWEPDVWYTMKLRVDQVGEKALVRGKVWRRGEPEPAGWTLEAEDPRPVRSGSPGLYGYSAAEIQYDNLKVTSNVR